MKKLFLILASFFLFVVLVIGSLIVIKMLGYSFNKDFASTLFTFNKQQCIATEYPTYIDHSGIEGCVFWMRNDYLEKTQLWAGQFKKDDAYCDSEYTNKPKTTILDFSDWNESNDPKCGYEGFKAQKRNENWNYLVSKEQDGIYKYCVDQICSRPPMFK